jgi:TDG/mug DNA glycosylase family protein
MTSVYCFAPIENTDSIILILGSMPGNESLRLGQYYAHQRNNFWSIIGEITGAVPNLPYEVRTQILKSNGIALWDVLASCKRSSSLDSDIDKSSIYPNDFKDFFLTHTHITHVFFNGAMAEKCFFKQVLPLPGSPRYQRLPSTSPANASIPYQQKLNIWRTAIEDALGSIRSTDPPPDLLPE